MKLLFDFFPIILFFIAFKTNGIYVATAVAIGASVVQVAAYWLQNRRFENMHLISLAIITIFGGMTLLLHDDTFIKWKPTILNWAFALIFLVAGLISDRNLVERMMSATIQAPKAIWQRMNWMWVAFFVVSGFINLYVAFYYGLDLPDERRTEIWVNFKLFGMLGMTFIFIVAQSLYLARHAEQNEEPAA